MNETGTVLEDRFIEERRGLGILSHVYGSCNLFVPKSEGLLSSMPELTSDMNSMMSDRYDGSLGAVELQEKLLDNFMICVCEAWCLFSVNLVCCSTMFLGFRQ